MYNPEAAQMVKQIEKAGLRAQYMQVPFVRSLLRGGENIFQMDIENRNSNQENFRFYPGVGTRFSLSDINKEHRQVMLHVQEPERKFLEEFTYFTEGRKQAIERLQGQGLKIVQVQGGDFKGKITAQRTTPSESRHMLVGHDELRYFICSVPGGPATVEAAHRALRPVEADVEGTKRQGEWFFVPQGSRTQAKIEEVIEENPYQLKREVPVFVQRETRQLASGTPHFASKLIWNETLLDNKVYVQGQITQELRHKPLQLNKGQWYQVVRNRELVNPLSVDWVD